MFRFTSQPLYPRGIALSMRVHTQRIPQTQEILSLFCLPHTEANISRTPVGRALGSFPFPSLFKRDGQLFYNKTQCYDIQTFIAPTPNLKILTDIHETRCDQDGSTGHHCYCLCTITFVVSNTNMAAFRISVVGESLVEFNIARRNSLC